MLSTFNNSYFLFQPNARQLASKIFQSYGSKRYPIPIKSIAETEGAIVKNTLILSDGALIKNNNRYIIKVNKTLHPYRQRFTIAHELGHILRNRLYQESASSYQCSTGAFLDKKKEERFCESFASYLLIPDETILPFSKWNRISVRKLLAKAHELKVSLTPLVWRVLEQAPHEGGFLWFRMMPKPTDPNDIKLRLDWGQFPKSQGIFLPRHKSVPEGSPIYQALQSSEEYLYRDVQMNFGSIRGKRTIIVRKVGQSVLTIVLPEKIKHEIMYDGGGKSLTFMETGGHAQSL